MVYKFFCPWGWLGVFRKPTNSDSPSNSSDKVLAILYLSFKILLMWSTLMSRRLNRRIHLVGVSLFQGSLRMSKKLYSRGLKKLSTCSKSVEMNWPLSRKTISKKSSKNKWMPWSISRLKKDSLLKRKLTRGQKTLKCSKKRVKNLKMKWCSKRQAI